MKRTFRIDGKDVQGEAVEFQAEAEPWTSLLCHDGTTIKTRMVISKVIRLDTFRPDGAPAYHVEWTNIINIDSPENLYRKSEEPAK